MFFVPKTSCVLAGALALALSSGCSETPPTPSGGAKSPTIGAPKTAPKTVPQKLALLDEIKRMGKLGAARVGEAVGYLNDPEVRVQLAAISTLAALAQAGADIKGGIDALRGAVSTSALDVRLAALDALGAAGPTASGARQTVLKALEAGEPAIRAAAVEALGHIEGAAQLSTLKSKLEDESGRVRAAASRAIGRLGGGASEARQALVDRLHDSDRTSRMWARQALTKVDPEHEAALSGPLKFLSDPAFSQAARRMAEDALIDDLGGKEAVQALADILEASAPEDEVLRQIALHLTRRFEKELGPILPALVSLLDDPDDPLRILALEIMTRAGGAAKAAVPALHKALGEGSKHARAVAAGALAAVGGESAQAIEALRPLLGDKDETVRAAAAKALGSVKANAGGVEVLMGMLDDGAAVVRAAAANGLRNAGETGARSVPRLVKQLSDPDEMVRAAVYEALGELLKWAEGQLDSLGPALAGGLKDGAASVRAAAVKALGAAIEGGWKAKDAIEALAGALSDEAGDVSAAAIEAIGRLGDEAESVLPELISVIESGSESARSGAVKALDAMGDAAQAAGPALKRLASKDGPIAEAAMEALKFFD